MKFDLILPELPSGYVAEFHPKGKPGPLKVHISGYYTIENGEGLIRALDGISHAYLSQLPKEKRPDESQINSLLAIVRKDKSCTLYINELQLVAEIITKRFAAKNDAVYTDDIADVVRMTIKDITIPSDAGFALVLSSGWRRGLFFDYGPFFPDKDSDRKYDFEATLAQVWAYITLQNRLAFSEKQWEEFFKQAWFPYSSLNSERIESIKNYAENSLPIDDMQNEIKGDLLKRCSEIRSAISTHAELEKHRDYLLKTVEHFQNSDWLSCSSMLYPRIEGVLRSWHEKVGIGTQANQNNLVKSAGTSLNGRPIASGLLLVPKFLEFLDNIYFADFDPAHPEGVSRHTVSHGVVPQEQLNLKSALTGMMILEQLIFLMSAGKAGVNLKTNPVK